MAGSVRRALTAVGVGLLGGAWAVRPENARSHGVSGADPEDRGEFSPSCKPYPGKRVVLVTLNDEYLEMFQNWLAHAKEFLQDTEHLHVIAEEDAVLPKLIALREKYNLDFSVAPSGAPPALAQITQPVTAGFGSDAFGSMMRKRPDYIQNFVVQGCSVLFIDIDTVLLHDPFKDVQAAGSADLYVTSNDPRLSGSRTEYCGCFLYMHPTAWVQKLMEDWTAAIEGKNTNQGALNDKLRERGVQMGRSDKVIVLSGEKYPPGGVMSGRLGKQYQPPPDPTMYHANWVGGVHKKTEFLKELGHYKPESLAE